MELRNRTTASVLWGFEKWASSLALDVAKSREGNMVFEVAAALLLAIVLVVLGEPPQPLFHVAVIT